MTFRDLPCKRVITTTTQNSRMRSILKKKFSHIGVLYRCSQWFRSSAKVFSPKIRTPFSCPSATVRGPRSAVISFPLSRPDRDSPRASICLVLARSKKSWVNVATLDRGYRSRSFSAPAKSVSRWWDRVLFHDAPLSRPARRYIARFSEDLPKPRIIDELRALLYLVLLHGTFFAPRKLIALSSVFFLSKFAIADHDIPILSNRYELIGRLWFIYARLLRLSLFMSICIVYTLGCNRWQSPPFVMDGKFLLPTFEPSRKIALLRFYLPRVLLESIWPYKYLHKLRDIEYRSIKKFKKKHLEMLCNRTCLVYFIVL